MHKCNREVRTFVFVLLPEFTMLAFSSAVEALRLANFALGYRAYAWRLVSQDGQPVTASCGVTVAVSGSVVTERARLLTSDCPEVVMICSGWNVERYGTKQLHAWLRQSRHHSIGVAGICTGAYILAEAGLLNQRRATIHWENVPGFVERFPNAILKAGLFETDQGIHTCAGGTACLDMMLHLIGEDFGDRIVSAICEQSLAERVRQPHDRQRTPRAIRLGIHNPILIRAIEAMEENLTDPLPLEEVSSRVALSRRQIERIFQEELHISPARYYIQLRLEKALSLLSQTGLPLIEVAIACGFVSSSHFSKTYREKYGESPQATRERNRVRSRSKDFG